MEGIGAHGDKLNDIHEDLAAYSLQGNWKCRSLLETCNALRTVSILVVEDSESYELDGHQIAWAG